MLLLKDCSVSCTTNQDEFHKVIDNISNLIIAPSVNSPQIMRGRAQDVYKLMNRDFSKFLRPTSKQWLFQEPIDCPYTLKKLWILNSQFDRYCCTKIPETYKTHCKDLQEYVKSAIMLIENHFFFN